MIRLTKGYPFGKSDFCSRIISCTYARLPFDEAFADYLAGQCGGDRRALSRLMEGYIGNDLDLNSL